MNKNSFIEELKKINIILTNEQLEKLDEYKELLKEYNQKFNLTSITEDEAIYLKHFYDCLYLLTIDKIKEAKSIVDIGTGAGFPGLVLATVLTNTTVTLVESNEKKCMFLKEVSNKLNINNIEVINERAETYAKTVRETYDIATSRAVSDLRVLLELEIPLIKENGYFIPLKSHIEEEINHSKDIIDELDVTIEDTKTYKLPHENSDRTILLIKKNKKTNNKYPREYNQIIKDLKKRQN